MFQRGRFLQGQLAEDGLPAAARFAPLPDDSRALLQRLIAAAQQGPDSAAALKMIDEARDLRSIEVIALVTALLSHADVDVRGNALSLLEGTSHTDALAVVEKALGDTSADVRIQAMEAMSRVNAPQTAPVLRKAFSDTDTSVRQLAFQAALRQDDATRSTLMQEGLQSPFVDLAAAVVDTVEGQPSKANVPLMMEALGSRHADIREKAHDSLYLTFHQNFTTTTAAKAWWNQNHRNYDDHLVLKNP